MEYSEQIKKIIMKRGIEALKKEISLIGRLVFPITIGKPAYVRAESGDRMTSYVVRIIEVNNVRVVFETRNTVYHLKLETSFLTH